MIILYIVDLLIKNKNMMKKITSKIFLTILLLAFYAGEAQCLIGTQYPAATWTAECNTVNPNVIVVNAWAGEYTLVNVVAGETYTFASSVATDYITISTDDGATASAFGVTPLDWTSDVTGVIRYYFHLSDLCGTENVARVRTIACGTPPCVQPQVTFSKTFDCGSSTFEVTADITDMGSASTITVTDDQASSSQSISSSGPVTFGPYPFGTTVVLTATNDDTPICNVVSGAQVILGCPPANDECDGAIVLSVNPDASCTNVTPGSIVAATASSVDAAACGGSEDDDVWYSFVAESTAQKISLINAVGSTIDLFHSLWTGDCEGLSLVPGTCSDADSSTPTGLLVGQTYYVRIYTFTDLADQSTTFDICIGTPPPPPANDDCVNAIALNCGDVLTSQITDSAQGGTGTSCVGTIGNDIWYSYAGDGQVVTLTATGTIEEPQVEVYASSDGTCTGFTPGTCIASAGSGAAVVTLNFVSVVGTAYYIHVGNWINGDPGVTFDLAITCEAPPTPPANDDCSGAEPLSVNPDDSCAIVASGTVEGATASAVDGASCGGTEDDDVWYSFVASDALQTIRFNNVAGTSTGLSSSVWSGDCNMLALVAGSCSAVNLRTVTGLTAGETYYVRVYTTVATPLQNTTFDICIGTPPPPPANDDCAAAIELTVGTAFDSSPTLGSNVSATSTVGLPLLSCVETNRSNDVWYSVVVPPSGTLTIETRPATNTVMTDSVLTVFSGVCGTLVEIGCDDDSSDIGNFSLVELAGLTAGDVIYIGVWRYGTTLDGEFQISAFDALLSNNNFESTNLKSFPNPVKDILNLSYNKNISNVAVFNLLGQEVITKVINSNQSQIDMSHLSAGTYLVKLTADNQVKTIKVIKE